MNSAPGNAQGSYADGFEPLASLFASQLESDELGASLSVYQHGRHVVDLYGGLADENGHAWEHDTRVVVFSVTKGLTAMALHLLAERGQLDWGARVADYWPEFAQAGKQDITVEMLLCHQAGLPYLDMPLTLEQLCYRNHEETVLRAIEAQRPAWTPGTDQGYHAITYGLYAKALFEKIAGERLEDFSTREVFEPLGSDARIGTSESYDAKIATLYPPKAPNRIGGMARAAMVRPRSAESKIAKAIVGGATERQGSMQKRAFLNPSVGRLGMRAYNRPPARRAALAWASATASADGIARAFLPFVDGTFEGKRWFSTQSLAALHPRTHWSQNDRILCKPLGWTRGFLKEERHLFSPNPASFGHAGMGGSLGWCDPTDGLTIGYVRNQLDWRVRARACVALCRALYECPAVIG